MSLNVSHLEYHGRGSNEIILTDPGTLVSDRTALETCTAVFTTKVLNWAALPLLNTPHPIFSYIAMEKRRLSIKGAYAIAECDFAGVPGGQTSGTTPPVYELSVGVSESPIETHPDFESTIGGTPMEPLNGAMFEHQDTKIKTWKGKNTPTSNDGYLFAGFLVMGNDGKLNPFAKIEHYLEASNMTWKATWNFRISTIQIGNVGGVDSPRGPCPALKNGRNWLNMGVTMTTRGSAYQSTEEWRASGRRGWNDYIYGK